MLHMKTFCYLFLMIHYTRTFQFPDVETDIDPYLSTLIKPVAQVANLADTGIEMYLVMDDNKTR